MLFMYTIDLTSNTTKYPLKKHFKIHGAQQLSGVRRAGDIERRQLTTLRRRRQGTRCVLCSSTLCS
jgi:hypothetical protein